MQTVDKAMKLLGYFSAAEPEIGLSELARLASFDKAATRRFLVALASHGLIEQDGNTRKYRLGPAFLRLARIREATRPLARTVQQALDGLSEVTGETAHGSMLSGEQLSIIGVAEPQRPTRVSVDASQPLPLHATASGLACLAFLGEEAARQIIGTAPLRKHTDHTCASKRDLKVLLGETRERGYSMAVRTFDDEVISIAAPIFDATGTAIGALSVASIASRFSKESERNIARHVLKAAAGVSEATGGTIHPAIAAALDRLRP
ncbi:IclR family transcriptional regulator [Bradyrhizobium sp.]|uniref:IclR family transcriptional regulator n=1 Tax=Bradyrhizobium sp. TaxID=376 RepID=UPI0040377904